MSVKLPILSSAAPDPPVAAPRLPRWLKRNVPLGNANHFTARLLEELRLETVCDNARCPNRMECYSQKTATFMILGNVCTRPCEFCSVAKGKTQPVELDEPERLAEAARRLRLAHVVITSVTRDDLSDGGASHFVRCIEAVRAKTSAAVEVLIPDFGGSRAALDAVIAARPEVLNHNTETVPRLYRAVRGRKSAYRWTLELLRHTHERSVSESLGIKTKSGLMLGLGETRPELLDTLADLREAQVDMLTLGQYLQPSPEHRPVVRFVEPAEFDELAVLARRLGFEQVASGPLVRSSYHAREMAEALPASAADRSNAGAT